MFEFDDRDEQARHEAVDSDLLDIRLIPDAPLCNDWRALCTDDDPPMTAAEERSFWISVALRIADRRENGVTLI